MCRGAFITVHSVRYSFISRLIRKSSYNFSEHVQAVVGSNAAQLIPTLESVVTTPNTIDISKVSLSREPLYQYLLRKIASCIAALSETLLDTSTSISTTKVFLCWSAWTSLLKFGLNSFEHVDVLRSLILRIPAILADPSCTIEQRGRLEGVSQEMSVSMLSPRSRYCF